MRSGIATALVVLSGLAILFWSTDGLRAFTAEGARRLAVSRQPQSLPDVMLETQDGRRVPLRAWRGSTTVVDFIYTRCDTYCLVMSNGMKVLHDALAQGNQDHPALLSISFDSANDTPERLASYARRHGADPRRWTFARVADARELPALLAAFGITVIPDGHGGFEHNAALHVLDRGGRLAGIFDYDKPLAPGLGIGP